MGQALVNEIDRFGDLLLLNGFDIYDEGKNTFPVYSNIEDIKDVNGIEFIYLNEKDVVRHKLVTDIVNAYKKFYNTTNADNEDCQENNE